MGCAGCERVEALHSWVLWSTLTLESEGRCDANRLPSRWYVDVTTEETGRQAWGTIESEPGHMTLSTSVGSRMPVLWGVGMYLEAVMSLYGRVCLEVTVSNSLCRDSSAPSSLPCSLLENEVRGTRVPVRNRTPLGHLGKQQPEAGAAGQMARAGR